MWSPSSLIASIATLSEYKHNFYGRFPFQNTVWDIPLFLCDGEIGDTKTYEHLNNIKVYGRETTVIKEECMPSIGVNRNGGVNRNTHQKSSSDLNFSKLKNHMKCLWTKLFIWFLFYCDIHQKPRWEVTEKNIHIADSMSLLPLLRTMETTWIWQW